MVYLLGQTALFILVAGLVGLFFGWLIWGKRNEEEVDEADYALLEQKLAQCEQKYQALEAQLSDTADSGDVESESESVETNDNNEDESVDVISQQSDEVESENEKIDSDASVDAMDIDDHHSSVVDEIETQSESQDEVEIENDDESSIDDMHSADDEIKDEWRPQMLAQPEPGEADNLKRIKGVGPVIEKTLNGLGIYHFHQIAEFTTQNIKWVDNYISFPGRILREGWVAQAKQLADGESTEFAARYDKKSPKK